MFEGSIKRPYKAVNTFSRRPCLNQILSYLLLALDNFSFWLTVQNHYASEIARYAIIALFLLSLLALLVLGGLTSSYDPADPIMAHHRNGLTYDAGNDELCLYCQHCESYVLMTSKHCKLCDRCVQQFDHHCVWINNCIGKCNYKVFIGMILMAWVHLIVYVVGVCVLWAQGGWGDFLAEMVLNWVVMGIVILFSLLLLALIILHFVLIAKNTTTFQFMLARKAAQINPAPKETIHTSFNQIHLKNKGSVVSERGDEGNQAEHRSTLHETPFKDINKEVSNQEQEQSQHFKESRLSIMRNSNVIKAKSEMDKRTELQLQSGTDILKSSKALKLLIGGSLKIKQMRRNVSCKALKKEKQADISNKSQEKYSEYQMKANQKFENINVIFQQ